MAAALLLALAAALIAWQRHMYRRHARMRSPLWLAFTFTTAAILFIGAGAMGYNLSRRGRFLDERAWTDGVIWQQVQIGMGMLLVAAICWWKAFHAELPKRS